MSIIFNIWKVEGEKGLNIYICNEEGEKDLSIISNLWTVEGDCFKSWHNVSPYMQSVCVMHVHRLIPGDVVN